MQNENTYFVNREEKIDYTELVKIMVDMARSADATKYVTLLIGKLKEMEVQIVSRNQEMRADFVKNIIPLYERTRNNFVNSMGRSIFSPNSGLQRETKASEFALNELKKILNVTEKYMKKSDLQVVEVMKQLASASTEPSIKLIESISPKTRISRGDGSSKAISASKGKELEELLLEQLRERET